LSTMFAGTSINSRMCFRRNSEKTKN
jgi:hypothetical protein